MTSQQKQAIAIAAGLVLGQLIAFILVANDSWQTVDTALFGVGIGVGLAALFGYLAKRS